MVRPQLGPGHRLLLIDALRGLAAMAVVGNHLYFKNLFPMGSAPLPEPLHWIFAHGHLGVPIFFVLSGFVIPYSVGARPITPAFFGSFALRRGIRLDPPYWATIFFSLAMTLVAGRFMSGPQPPFPSTSKIVAHFFYAQDLVQLGNIVGAFWTLCIEFQFYLVFIALVGVAQWLGRRPAAAAIDAWHLAVFAPLFGWSLAISCGSLPDPLPGLFVRYWYAFVLGMVATWVVTRRTHDLALWVVSAVVAGAMIYSPSETGITALITVSLIYLAARLGTLSTWTLGRPLQYLGRISYSLYLIHIEVGSRVVRIGSRFVDTRHQPVTTALVLLADVAASLVAAHLLYTFVEAPSIRFSARVREYLERRSAGRAAAASALAQDLRQ